MLAIKGIYDGKKIKLLEQPPDDKKYKVVVTFIEEINNEEDLRNFTSDASSFSFWEEPKEDIYQDYSKKKRKS